MKKFCLLITLTFVVSVYLFAQNVTVTASAGTANATYATLKAAYDAINAGTHQGVIQIDLQGSFAETAPAVLNRSGSGSANYSSILIQPIAPATITGTFFSNPLVDFNGAENVIIDGRIGGAGSTRSLTLQNLSTSNNAGTSTIRFRNDAANDIVRYVNLEGSSRGAGTGTVIFMGSTGALGNRQIDISNNDIRPAGSNMPFNAIYSAGQSAAVANNNIRITNNLMHDMFNLAGQAVAIFANTNNTAWTVNGNSIYQTAPRTTTANSSFFGISFNSGDGHIISGNYIGGSTSGAGGATTTINGGFTNRFIGMSMVVGSTTASNIDGNVITNLNLSTTATSAVTHFFGMNVQSGLVQIGINTGNTIGSLTGAGAITCNISNTTFTWVSGINTQSGPANIQNNMIGSITVNGASTGQNLMRGIESNNHSSVTIQDNTIGGTTPGSIQANAPNNAFNGVLIGSGFNHTATVSGNTIQNIVNNAIAPNTASIFGIENSIHTAGVSMTTNFTNNIIRGFSAPSATAATSFLYGILITGIATTSTDANITGNQIYDFNSASNHTVAQVEGIALTGTYPNFLNVNNNLIHTLSAASNYVDAADGAVQGIDVGATIAGTLNISGNTVHNLEGRGTASATHIVGLRAVYGGSGATISRNKIYDLRQLNNSSGIVSGMYLRGQGNAGTFTVHNNMVSLSPPDVQVYGIHNNETAGQLNMYFNSIYIGGSESGSNASAGFSRNGATVGTPVHLRNNIFYITRSGGTPYPLINNHTTPSTGWTNTSSDYNVLFNQNSSAVALWGTSALNLAAFQSTSGGDMNSRSVLVNFANPSAGDLHLTGASLGDQNLAGITIPGITEDFDGNTRGNTPYIGSDEFPAAPLPIVLEYFKGRSENGMNILTWKAFCTGDFVHFDVERSTDGRNFTKSGTIVSGALACHRPFEFVDKNSEGILYYRLKTTDEDGVVTYSRTIVLSNSKSDFVFGGMSPTIVRGNAYLMMSANKKTLIEIRVFAIDGRTVMNKRIIADQGSSNLELDLAWLPAGVYQLAAYTHNRLAGTIRFVKQ